jgi:hypothetical protein
MKDYIQLSAAVVDMVDLVLNGELIEALTKYYHQSAWLPKRAPLTPYTNGETGRRALQALACNKCLFAEQVVNVNIGAATTAVTWVYSGTVGSALKSTFTVMSIQHWQDGKVVSEEYVHMN